MAPATLDSGVIQAFRGTRMIVCSWYSRRCAITRQHPAWPSALIASLSHSMPLSRAQCSNAARVPFSLNVPLRARLRGREPADELICLGYASLGFCARQGTNALEPISASSWPIAHPVVQIYTACSTCAVATASAAAQCSSSSKAQEAGPRLQAHCRWLLQGLKEGPPSRNGSTGVAAWGAVLLPWAHKKAATAAVGPSRAPCADLA